ncbi:MAG: hypothetical protein EOS63_10135 [Mesorhizobium sp.]|uniref:hypothetical protein n=1 Tax=Mesorhizobium sp. TaxID=1871066 RepID=UPI000FE8F822|nr:hypothetical protein [Mesorhizobium sp.]RWE81181.1 MAG: hypothetical protein EOS63_10135 [Mesorhizobium sp.]TIT12257.1 MAG: hypothetical protein E5W74_10320 [Mesorhizobium sp.]TJW62104.1 MAG: hypothetical protein E5V97_18140 [Mesorhizobium sp.]
MTLRKTLLASLAILALAAAPALAGNGHGGGNGGSHGGNGGNGNGGGNAGGNGKSGAEHGKSASAHGHNKGTDDSATDDTTTAATPKEKNLHAKLGRLNSLQRNINAYMNSKSKKFAGIQAYVTAAAAAQNAQAALDAANAQLTTDQNKLADLTQQLADLNATDTTGFTPEQQAALDAQITDVQSQIDAQNAAITADTQAVADAQTEVTNTPAPDDATLDAALQDMANKPVDQEVTDWAKGVLADKIDQAAAATTTP